MDKIDGFSQKIIDAKFIETSALNAEHVEDISVNEMALRCLNYLNRTPQIDKNFECKFSNGLLSIPWHYPLSPPNKTAFDPVSLGDTDIRNMIAFPYMREMAHINSPSVIENGLRKRLDGYMSKDGVCIQGAQAFSGQEVEGEWNCIWGTSHMAIIYCDEFEKSGDLSLVKKACKAMDFWINVANKKDNTLFFENGGAPFKDGQWLSVGWASEHKTNYPYIIVALLRVYKCSNDKKYLDAAIAFGYGVTRYSQTNMGVSAIKPDGSFSKHVPLHTKLIAGMAMLGMYTNNKEFILFAYNAYNYIIKMGADFGWYPEYIPPEENIKSETCVVGDMLEISYYLIKCGYIEEYDRVERTYKNYLQSAQFKMTKEFKQLYFSLHKDKNQEVVKENFDTLSQMVGGFIAQLSINDYITNFKHLGSVGMNENGFQMMGCCPGAGMNGLYYLYKMLCEYENGIVNINMSISGETDYAIVDCDYSAHYKLTIVSKIDASFKIKIPKWTNFDVVEVAINGKQIKCNIDKNGFILLRNINICDKIQVYYPLISFVQEFEPKVKATNQKFKIHWVGNKVVNITPKGDILNIY